MTSRTPIYYTRCPVPTASGVAFQTGMFVDAFKESDYVVPNITELGPEHQDVHYTHSIDMFIREGGVAPPVWARANGVDSVVLGITFMEEFQGVFVRTDDPAETVADLVGRRLALPVWPRLVFNFWRFAALKGLISALAVHNVAPAAVQFVDIVEGWDPSERRNVGRDDLNVPARCEYRGQLEALLAGEVDAIFGKGPEAALLQREGEGGVRLLYDVRSAPGVEERINNSTPRIITTSRYAVEEHFDAVVRYTQTAIRAANWVQDNPAEARSLIARECSIDADDIETYLEPDYRDKFLPRLDEGLVDAVEFVKSFLHEHGFIDQDFALDEWIDPRPLQQAYEREGLAPNPSH